KLVPDRYTVQLWRENIEAQTQLGRFHPERDTLVLDGIPRNRHQAELPHDALNVVRVFNLVCGDTETLVERLQRRPFRHNRRTDGVRSGHKGCGVRIAADRCGPGPFVELILRLKNPRCARTRLTHYSPRIFFFCVSPFSFCLLFMSPLRIIFFGTAELACPSLSALAQTPAFEVAAVVTQRDRPQGRKLNLQPSPVKILATQKKLPVLQPERARDEGFLQ